MPVHLKPTTNRIPFIRRYPNGRVAMQTIERSFPIFSMANNFIHAGGRYVVSISDEGRVELAAILIHRETREEVECASDECANDRSLPHKIDELVRDSVRWLAHAGLIARETSIITDVH